MCSFIQRLNYHNKTIDRPSLSRARTLSTVCEERVRRSVAILMTALCGGGGTTGTGAASRPAGSYIAGVTLLTRRPSGRSMRYVNQYSTARACSSSTTTDGRICGTGPRLLCFACMHALRAPRQYADSGAVPRESDAARHHGALVLERAGAGAGPHPRTDAPIPIPCKRRRDRHHWRAYGLSRCGGGTHDPIGRCSLPVSHSLSG